jgi:hypothetical protein
MEHEQSVNTKRRSAARKDEEVREAENDQQRNRRRLNPETRSREQSVDTIRRAAAGKDEEVRERENEPWHNRQEAPGVQENKSTNRAARRAKRTYNMACTYKNGKFHFGQPCGS